MARPWYAQAPGSMRSSRRPVLVLLVLLGAPEARGTEPLSQRLHGELRWGCDAQGGAPYVFTDPTDPSRLIGFEVELANELANRLGLRAKAVQGPWEQLLALLDRGDVDVVLNGIEITPDRRIAYRLTQPYYAGPLRLTIRKGDVRAPRALGRVAGRRVGTLPGSLAERTLRAAGADVKTYDGGQDDLFRDLKLGRTDAVLADAPIADYYGALEPALEVLDSPAGDVRYAVAIRASDPELAGALDQTLGALVADGTLARILGRWRLWTKQTGEVLGVPGPPADVIPQAWLEWEAAAGLQLSFFQRLVDRYPMFLPLLLRGAALTVELSVAAMILAVVLGAALALARVYGARPLRLLATSYIELVRGTPLLLQLIVLYFGLPEVGIRLHPFVAGWLALGLNYAAAEAENDRAGLLSVPLTQLEAARVLGLSRWQGLRYVVAPQALRVVLPPATNDFIALLKDSSLVSVVTLAELTRTYENLASATRDHLGLGLVVAVLYLVLGLPFARLSRWLEARLGAHLATEGSR
jgi:polar amino acid transport system substrate-binding protein